MKEKCGTFTAIILAVLLVCIPTVSIFAASSLSKRDFDYYGGDVHTLDKQGYSTGSQKINNYVDYVMEKKNPNLKFYFREYGYDSDEVIKNSNRGMNLGASTSQVIKAYGKGTTDHISSLANEPAPLQKYYNPDNLPDYKITYNYYYGGYTFHKTFYFNKSDKLNFILWWANTTSSSSYSSAKSVTKSESSKSSRSGPTQPYRDYKF